MIKDDFETEIKLKMYDLATNGCGNFPCLCCQEFAMLIYRGNVSDEQKAVLEKMIKEIEDKGGV